MKIIKKILTNNSRKVLAHFYFESEENDTEMINVNILSDTDEFKITGLDKAFTVTQVWHSFAWFDALLKFDDVTPSPSWVLSRDSTCYHDFRYFGGIRPDQSMDAPGQVLMTTNGFSTTPGACGTMVLELKKD